MTTNPAMKSFTVMVPPNAVKVWARTVDLIYPQSAGGFKFVGTNFWVRKGAVSGEVAADTLLLIYAANPNGDASIAVKRVVDDRVTAAIFDAVVPSGQPWADVVCEALRKVAPERVRDGVSAEQLKRIGNRPRWRSKYDASTTVATAVATTVAMDTNGVNAVGGTTNVTTLNTSTPEVIALMLFQHAMELFSAASVTPDDVRVDPARPKAHKALADALVASLRIAFGSLSVDNSLRRAMGEVWEKNTGTPFPSQAAP